MRNKILTRLKTFSSCPMIFEWPFFFLGSIGTTGPTAEKNNIYSVLCFNKRTVIFISLKRIEIKVFLLVLLSAFWLVAAREISSRVCVYENLLMFFFIINTIRFFVASKM